MTCGGGLWSCYVTSTSWPGQHDFPCFLSFLSYCNECMLDPDCGFCYKMNNSAVIDSSCVPVNKASTNEAAWGRYVTHCLPWKCHSVSKWGYFMGLYSLYKKWTLLWYFHDSLVALAPTSFSCPPFPSNQPPPLLSLTVSSSFVSSFFKKKKNQNFRTEDDSSDKGVCY